MVCCLQPDPVFGCDDVASFDGDEYKCKKLPKKKCCDCSKFAGCDHLKGKRARKYRCNKRIRRLANPKWMTEKHCGQGMAMPNKRIEIIRLEEEQTPVRIRMLAYPKVRKLVSNRNDYKRIVDKQWYGQIETFIEKSMKTMYSRLANVHLPDQCRRKKWTKEDWQHHCEWLQKRALPKVAKPSPRINRKRVPLDTLLPSLLELSKPKKAIQKFRYRCGFQSAVKHAAMLYQPTERIKILSLPKKLNKDEEEPENPFAVNPNALKYQPSEFPMKVGHSVHFNFLFFHSRSS